MYGFTDVPVMTSLVLEKDWCGEMVFWDKTWNNNKGRDYW